MSGKWMMLIDVSLGWNAPFTPPISLLLAEKEKINSKIIILIEVSTLSVTGRKKEDENISKDEDPKTLSAALA